MKIMLTPDVIVHAHNHDLYTYHLPKMHMLDIFVTTFFNDLMEMAYRWLLIRP